MRNRREIFAYTRDISTKNEHLGAAWPLYEDFEVEEKDGEVYVYAPFRPPNAPEAGAVIYPCPLEDLNLRQTYAPLREEPGLFLRFASLARKGPLSRDEMLEVVLDWAKRYGVLGLEGTDYLEVSGRAEWGAGRRESLSGFAQAVREAARCLGLYEAGTALGTTAVHALDKYKVTGRTVEERQEMALKEAADMVGNHLESECYPVLYREFHRETERTIGFAQGWGFRSLLGAMYLQLGWLMTEGSGVRSCKGPGCSELITFDRSRKDKEFCSKNCKEKWRYHVVVKPNKQRKA
jgi:hypothetical protein